MLDAVRREQAQRDQLHEHLVEDPRLGAVAEQALAEVAQYSGIEPIGVEGQVQGILPLQVNLDRLGGLAVGQVLQRLEHQHQCDQHRRDRRATLFMVQVGEVLVVVVLVEQVADQLVGVIGGEMLLAPGSHFRRHGARRLGLQAHGAPPKQTTV